MTGYDLYVFIVGLVTFFALVGLFLTMMLIIVAKEIKAITYGIEDDKITKEYEKHNKRRASITTTNIVVKVLLLVITIIAVIFFVWSSALRFRDPEVKGDVAMPRVVLSDSMSYQRESNKYLEENGLDDQFDTFDIVFMRDLPDEFELELYDVVIYELRDELIIHRIVGIEEPNEQHPDHRLFELRGDAVKNSDEFKVEYSQMKAIYRGEKIQYAGSFIYFMQSPLGYLCILLLVVGAVLSPILELMVSLTKRKRLAELGYFDKQIKR